MAGSEGRGGPGRGGGCQQKKQGPFRAERVPGRPGRLDPGRGLGRGAEAQSLQGLGSHGKEFGLFPSSCLCGAKTPGSEGRSPRWRCLLQGRGRGVRRGRFWICSEGRALCLDRSRGAGGRRGSRTKVPLGAWVAGGLFCQFLSPEDYGRRVRAWDRSGHQAGCGRTDGPTKGLCAAAFALTSGSAPWAPTQREKQIAGAGGEGFANLLG